MAPEAVPEAAVGSLVLALAESLHARVDDLNPLDVRDDDVSDQHRCEVERVLLARVFAPGQKHLRLHALRNENSRPLVRRSQRELI